MHATALSRRPRLTAPAFCLALLAALPAAGQGTKADYERAHALAERFSGKLARSRVEPVWVSETRFWPDSAAQHAEHGGLNEKLIA
ncbi:MAG: hypothetical protein AAF790_06765, partial [Planctomycetota bacterium]